MIEITKEESDLISKTIRLVIRECFSFINNSIESKVWDFKDYVNKWLDEDVMVEIEPYIQHKISELLLDDSLLDAVKLKLELLMQEKEYLIHKEVNNFHKEIDNLKKNMDALFYTVHHKDSSNN
jgi:hypothetical protein